MAKEGRLLCMPLKTVTDGPLFGRPPGTLSALQNMNLLPGGYAESRGGTEKIKPLGGTEADAISAGGYGAVHQLSTSTGWVRRFESNAAVGSQFSRNLQLSAPGYVPFLAGLVGDAIYLGADSDFSRIQAFVSQVGAWTSATFAYEYSKNALGTTWGTLTTSETIDWTVLGLQYASWTAPTDWVAATVGDAGTGNVLKKWIRIRLSAITALTAAPAVFSMAGFWVGMRELYEVSHSPRTSAIAGTLKRHGQNTGTIEEWFSISTTMFSGTGQPSRVASYRGRIFVVNGKDQKRFDGRDFKDIGVQPHTTGYAAPVVNAGTGIGVGIFRYYAAWGEGQTRETSLTHPLDAKSLYGVGRASYLGEVTTTAANEVITIVVGGTIPEAVGAIYFYRTQDLTGVPASKRAQFPAFLVDSLRRRNESTAPAVLEGGATFTDANPEPLFPYVEAIFYDNSPPSSGLKYVTVYQNRLVVGTDDTWYWSDAFKPDVYNTSVNFIALARATGGRHMGGLEHADQVVLFTEDQTWGLTNIDLDVPQLYPIHPAVGCVAPDAAASGDGLAIWPGRDGFYAWDGGTGLPVKISGDMDQTFGALSYETIGGSTACIEDRKYTIRLASPDNVTIGLCWRFDMQTGTWSEVILAGFTSTLFPLASIHAPLGNRDAGGLHSVWGKRDYGTGAGNYALFLGDLTTQDNGTNFTCLATMHFQLDPSEVLAPSRVLTYYSAADGWSTPILIFSTTSVIGSTVGSLTSGTPDTGDDYSVLGGTFGESNRGTSDLKVSFAVVSLASGTPKRQRFYGGVMEGVRKPIRKGMV